VDLDRMLDKCRRYQWRIDQLDWSVEPRPMDRETEITVVQYFTDMAAIELLAKELFVEQRRRATDPRLHKIFSTFIADEERHSQVAARLAGHYDVHGYREYTTNESLVRFQPHFLHALRYLSAEIANVYITAGELLLDIALLRSIDDFVDDDMSRQAMVLINRDESRHIAIDYYMVEYYASDEYLAKAAGEPGPPLRQRLEAAWALSNVVWYAKPFFIDVFLTPINMCDPSGRRLREAIKRLQLISQKPNVARRPFPRFLNGIRRLYQTPVIGKALGGALSRIGGAPGELLVDLYTAEDVARVQRMSFDELAEDALAAKHLH
jgi:hypothetical protein